MKEAYILHVWGKLIYRFFFHHIFSKKELDDNRDKNKKEKLAVLFFLKSSCFTPFRSVVFFGSPHPQIPTIQCACSSRTSRLRWGWFIACRCVCSAEAYVPWHIGSVIALFP